MQNWVPKGLASVMTQHPKWSRGITGLHWNYKKKIAAPKVMDLAVQTCQTSGWKGRWKVCPGSCFLSPPSTKNSGTNQPSKPRSWPRVTFPFQHLVARSIYINTEIELPKASPASRSQEESNWRRKKYAVHKGYPFETDRTIAHNCRHQQPLLVVVNRCNSSSGNLDQSPGLKMSTSIISLAVFGVISLPPFWKWCCPRFCAQMTQGWRIP